MFFFAKRGLDLNLSIVTLAEYFWSLSFAASDKFSSRNVLHFGQFFPSTSMSLHTTASTICQSSSVVLMVMCTVTGEPESPNGNSSSFFNNGFFFCYSYPKTTSSS
ncbi:hypothetical protein CHARACLAT_010314 [Characodon lateralis]|uniref:Uncharacterized protein n=1 Tax=Characodon lateralis TaxID=208331 RepID=A0ABU7ESI8_9TELE|nr:hypothetical protein [Characodon lateralis]